MCFSPGLICVRLITCRVMFANGYLFTLFPGSFIRCILGKVRFHEGGAIRHYKLKEMMQWLKLGFMAW